VRRLSRGVAVGHVGGVLLHDEAVSYSGVIEQSRFLWPCDTKRGSRGIYNAPYSITQIRQSMAVCSAAAGAARQAQDNCMQHWHNEDLDFLK
jgi:N-acyl-L-homoserine lactone synthetase